MASATLRRRASATDRAAAKQRRQTILLAVLAVVLLAVLAFVIPHLMKGSQGSGSPAASPVVVASPPPAASHKAKQLRGAGKGGDPFAVWPLANGDARAAGAAGPDPFTAPSEAPAEVSAPASQPLPKQLVIGKPGGNRVATHGWIVILASIPVGDGRDAATRFASHARPSVGKVSILNSTFRRPLRGGYWVVYSGPYGTLSEVSQRAGDVRAAGYRTAYLRELITYR